MATDAQPKTAIELDRTVRNCASWCFWIAALTAVNAVLTVSGSDVSFLVGTMIAQGVMYLAKDSSGLMQILALAFNVAVIGFFVGMGLCARKGKRWAFVLAFVAYALDSAVLFLAPEAIAIAFHAWALFSLGTGFVAVGRLNKAIEAEAAAALVQTAQSFAPPPVIGAGGEKPALTSATPPTA